MKYPLVKPISIFSSFLLTFLLVFNASASETKELDIDGLKVIYKPSPKEVISVRLFIEGGTANYSKEQEGIEALALTTAIEGGTRSKSKIAFSSAAEKIGANFGSGSTYDYGNLNMTCIKMFWDQSWDLFVDAVMNPAFDEKEFGLVKEQKIATAKQTESDPDSHLRNLAMANVYTGKNYSKIPEGTPESLEKLNAGDAAVYYKKVIGKKSCFLVVVGNIDEADLINKVKSSMAKMPMGKAPSIEGATVITKSAEYIEDRDIATNYIRGLMTAPSMSSDDGVPMRIAMSILRDRYFLELRTKRSLSYAPAAFYASAALSNPYNVIYISTLDPKQSMQVMVDEINKVKKVGFEEKELTDQKLTFLTYYFRNLETSSSQSNALGMAEMSGSWEMMDEFTKNVEKTTLKDLNRVFDKYTNAIQWVYLGKQDMVKKEDFVQTIEMDAKKKPY